MNEIPAFARIWFCSPESESNPATIPMPRVEQIAAVSMSVLRPNLSTSKVPVMAPTKLVTELTKLSTRCLSGSRIPAALRSMGRKSGVS